ncbi:MAG: HAD hydrolase family protein [Planctomycetaceae bacterium]|nr:HAD hydrolase family protein [Planctomycetaceae bacterium]
MSSLSNKPTLNLEQKCQKIRLILSDVDGVLTNGTIIYNNNGVELKNFHVRDGLGIKLWQQSGAQFGIITSRSSQIVRMRAAELDITLVRQSVLHKQNAVEEILQSLKLSWEHLCFIGDDLPDILPIKHSAFGVAVADANAEVLDAADYVTTNLGGYGAVRETIELILKSQRRWESVVQQYH